MKSKERPSKDLISRVEQEVYKSTVEACHDNNAFFLIAMSEVFGFAGKRLERVIKKYDELQERYTEYRNDGYSYEEVHDIICERLNEIGVNPAAVYTETNDFYDVRMEQKRREKTPAVVSFREAAEAQKHMEAMKRFMAEQNSAPIITKAIGIQIH